MKNNPIALFNFWIENKKILRLYISFSVITLLSIVGFLIFEGRILYASAFVALLLSVWVITQPKIALYQYMFVMFTNYIFFEHPVILLVDISALIVIITALFDILLKGEYQFSFPKLSFNFLCIILVFCIVAFFAYEPSLSVMPILHFVFLSLTFVSLYSLFKYISVHKLLHLFFIFAIIHALIALMPLIGASKVERLFGFARSTLDDIMMLAFPIGLVFFIKSSSHKTFYYVLSLLVIIAALIATQSRLSIMFAFVFGMIAIFISLKKGQIKTSISYKRVQMIILSAVTFIILLFIFRPEYISALTLRFDSLLSSSPSETFLVRIILWTNALATFVDHPFLGIGLGHYKILNTIYSSIHLNYMFPYIQGYSAHNMLFHYLAESGILGAAAVFALIINQFRYAFKVYRKKKLDVSEVDICLFTISLLILVTSFIEAGWLWGQIGYIFLFFIALNVKNYEATIKK